MACNRETSADGTTSSTTPVCPNADARVPCCNNNCHFFGCAATMNLCSKCYSEHILKEGDVFLNKPCDAPPVDTLVVRSNVDCADKANDLHIQCIDNSTERIVDASSSGGSAVDTSSAADPLGLRHFQRSSDKSSVRTTMMHTSAGVSDLRAVFGLVDAGDMFADTSDSRQQQIPSPLSLSSGGSLRVFSPVPRQVETKLPLPPLPPRQQAVNRCLACRKRVGLIGFKCRCGDIFCALHRYSDKHDCSFDYKAAGRAAIAKENPIVKASKIERI